MKHIFHGVRKFAPFVLMSERRSFMIDIDLTPVLQALAGLIATVITALIIPYIKSKTDAHRLERMQAWTTLAVKAAEQIFKEQGSGEQKKAYVNEFLEIGGFNSCEHTAQAMIESTVNAMNNEYLTQKEADN